MTTPLERGRSDGGPDPLVRELTTLCCAGAPLVDVVFVHGIRGGAFATWRASGGQYGAASRNLRHGVCWPSAWLAEDVPGARLLTVEYAAPVSAWEVRRDADQGTNSCIFKGRHAAGPNLCTTRVA